MGQLRFVGERVGEDVSFDIASDQPFRLLARGYYNFCLGELMALARTRASVCTYHGISHPDARSLTSANLEAEHTYCRDNGTRAGILHAGLKWANN